MKTIIIVAGVAGTGKSTISQLLYNTLHSTNPSIYFQDADDFHSLENKEKMKRGQGLTDLDRIPWLERCREWLQQSNDVDEIRIMANSALKVSYRLYLSGKINLLQNLPLQQSHQNIQFILVYLHAQQQVLLERLRNRSHFVTETLLESQLETLEPPTNLETPWKIISIEVTEKSPKEIVGIILQQLQL